MLQEQDKDWGALRSGHGHVCYLVVITEKLFPFRIQRAAVASGERSHTRAQSHIQMCMCTRVRACTHAYAYALGCSLNWSPPMERHTEDWLVIVLSYGLHMVIWLYCYGENENFIPFRGSLGNYMAVMHLSFNRLFRCSVYATFLGGKSIKLITFTSMCPGSVCWM